MSFERLPTGEMRRATPPEVHSAYAELRNLHLSVVKGSGDLWNWPAVLTSTAMTLARILHLNHLYTLILDVPGVICEFGTHWGASAAILRNLHQIHEPNNRSRELHLFDTWEGFRGVGPEDLEARDGDFSVPIDWAESLQSVLGLLDVANRATSAPSAILHQGDARTSFAEFLESDPGKLIALAFLDMDIYEPTRGVLELLEQRLVAGGIVVFDELNYPPYPGETVAFLESRLRWGRLVRSPFLPFSAYTVVQARA